MQTEAVSPTSKKFIEPRTASTLPSLKGKPKNQARSWEMSPNYNGSKDPETGAWAAEGCDAPCSAAGRCSAAGVGDHTEG